MKKGVISFRNEQTEKFFAHYGIDLCLVGIADNPLFVDKGTGEVLNCYFSKNGLAIIFKFNQSIRKKFILQIESLFEKTEFNFNHWFEVSSKKKIFVFHKEKQFFARYDVINNNYVPMFSESLSNAYFVFNYEKALHFQQKLRKFGVEVQILKQWKILKTY